MSATNGILRGLVKEFKPGYELLPVSSTAWQVLDPEGLVVRRANDNRPLLFGGDDSCPDTPGNTRRQLVAAGVIAPPERRRKAHMDASVSEPPPRARKLPHVLATETLRDTKASPRERALAGELLRLRDEVARLRELDARLVRRLQEVAP